LAEAPNAFSRKEPLSPDLPRFSVVITVYNETENVEPVGHELLAVLQPMQPFEIVFVDDGSTDATPRQLEMLCRQHASIRALRHDRRCGQSAALRTGIAAARAPWIVTMDGDGQNDPADIPQLLHLAWTADGAAPLVAGIRVHRNDKLSRRIAARLANGLREAVLSDRCPDTGCALKAFRREDFLRLPQFDGVHRYLPALFQSYGRPLICAPVAHRARLQGQSKYTNFGRAMIGIADMLGVIWLRSRTRLPREVTEI
jgi:dolichol-phosphate mannosyltransferase